MGIEYTHYLFVEDLSYIGTPATAMALEGVLAKWGLMSGGPTIRSLDGGKAKTLRQSSIGEVSSDIANLLVEYPFTASETIAGIMGSSAYDDVDSRYMQEIVLLVGSDYRIYSGHETACTTITAPPVRNGREVKLYKPNCDISYYADAYPGDAATEPPSAVLDPDLQDWPLPKGFSGIWRCGVILDCGKDVPAFMQKTSQLPSTNFAADIEKAFGAKIVQVGHFY